MNKIEVIVKNLSKKKTFDPDSFPEKFYQIFKEEIMPVPQIFFQRIEGAHLIIHSTSQHYSNTKTKERRLQSNIL